MSKKHDAYKQVRINPDLERELFRLKKLRVFSGCTLSGLNHHAAMYGVEKLEKLHTEPK